MASRPTNRRPQSFATPPDVKRAEERLSFSTIDGRHNLSPGLFSFGCAHGVVIALRIGYSIIRGMLLSKCPPSFQIPRRHPLVDGETMRRCRRLHPQPEMPAPNRRVAKDCL